jgi:site-specific recombinase XerD
MTTTAFYSAARPSVIRRLHEGPLGPYIDEYASRLVQQGLSRITARRTLCLIADLSRWLEQRRLTVDQLDEEALMLYRRYRARTRSLGFGEPVALRRFLGSMRELDICPMPPPAILSPHAKIQEEFSRYLAEDIGLSKRTLEHYTGIIAPFLREQSGADGPCWSTLTSAKILKYFRCCSRERSPQYMQRLRTALRSFLRYLQFRGEVQVDLSNCIPGVMSVRLKSVPKYLSTSQVQRLLGACRRNTAEGRRDYAVLMILARLGLRAVEVSSLSLDDIDWHEGRLTVHSKGGERTVMPLPHEVGRALADYLQNGRPHSYSRRVFLRHHAPHVGFAKSGSISALVKFAMQRAQIDLPSRGAHVFRHTLATQMLSHGASLREIGQVLRHRRPATTCIYAKVDLPTLRSVALSWPEDTQ